MKLKVDISYKSLNKRNEELCGDHIELLKTENSTILILADGMGSGVKANILSNLTTKIISKMVSHQVPLEDIVETIVGTLPVCSVRNVAYSTFTILKIRPDGQVDIIDFDGLPPILISKGFVDVVERTPREIAGKKINEARLQLKEGDFLLITSDGVTEAGLGLTLPLGLQTSGLVKALKENVSLPIELHTHYTSGVASMSCLKAVEAGCDIIDTAISPLALGTSQPATEVMVETFKGTPYDTGLNQDILAEINEYFGKIREEAMASGLLNPKVLGVNINTLRYQVPGGMLSNMISQLKEQNAEDKYEEVLKEIPRVRKDLGEPPLVTPSSQIVGTQAVLNVLMGERYKVATKETKSILLGEYGQTVKPFNPEVVEKVLGADKDKAITCRPADLIEPELAKIENEMSRWKQQDEDVLSYALFPQQALDFFKYREAQQTKVDPEAADHKNGAYPV